MRHDRRVYGKDLALIHDAGFRQSLLAAPGIIELLRRAGIGSGKVVDAGCGSGLLLRALRDAGYDAEGFDLSPPMVELAKQNAPGVPVSVASLQEYRFSACSAVVAAGEVVNYFPPSSARRDLRDLLGRVSEALVVGGMLIFDAVVASAGPLMSYRYWHDGEGWMVAVDVEEERHAERLLRRIVTFVKRRSWQRSEELHTLFLHDRSEVEQALREGGFSVRVMRRYGELELPPRRVAFVARKEGAVRRSRVRFSS